MRRPGSRSLVLLVLITGASACASAVHSPGAFPGAPARTSVPRSGVTGPASLSAESIVTAALSLRGIPYRLGGETPDSGLDCSGLVRFVFAQQGLDIPRTVAEQFGAGRRIRTQDLQPGDLIFFSTTGPGATHVGIATEIAGEFVHAPGTGGAVRVDRIDSPYWRARIAGARRLFNAPASGSRAAKHRR
jgi:cell wall-associated NlpC family hydrolase